ncbi:hypothetical protein AUK22_07620 [bacterium CG2_30_54_10]|nr:MAG: hypothetical protein AUK22_07620 [bacterium CG2_30_54_10]
MITDEQLQISVVLSGKEFFPSRVNGVFEVALSSCQEPGSQGRSGRKIEFGSAVVDLPAGLALESSDTLSFFAKIQDGILKTSSRAESMEITVHVTARYEDQCNLEFPLPFLKAVSGLGANLTLTCTPIPR